MFWLFKFCCFCYYYQSIILSQYNSTLVFTNMISIFLRLNLEIFAIAIDRSSIHKFHSIVFVYICLTLNFVSSFLLIIINSNNLT